MKSWTHTLVVFALVMALLLVVYILSSGPAIYLWNAGYIPGGMLVVYLPIEYVGFKNATAKEVLKSYWDLWRDPPAPEPDHHAHGADHTH
jgi:hypothetical protein